MVQTSRGVSETPDRYELDPLTFNLGNDWSAESPDLSCHLEIIPESGR